MNNDIEALIWDKEDKIMYEAVTIPTTRKNQWSPLIVVNGGLISSISHKNYVVRFKTPIHDVRGRNIYEGDIVKDIKSEKVGYIAFLKQALGYVLVLEERDVKIGPRYGSEGFLLLGDVYRNAEMIDWW